MKNTDIFELKSTGPLGFDWKNNYYNYQPAKCSIDPGHTWHGLPEIMEFIDDEENISLDADILWSRYSDCLVSARLAAAFAENGVTGFVLKPVRIFDSKGILRSSKDFMRLIVVGWGGIAPESSGVRLLSSCPGCGLRSYSRFTHPELMFDASQWNGDHIFMIWPLPGYILVTKSLIDLLMRYNIAYARFLRLDKLNDDKWYKIIREIDGYELTLGGRKLEHYMPIEYARLYSKKYGI